MGLFTKKHLTKVVPTYAWWVVTCNKNGADQENLPYAIFMIANEDAKNQADAEAWMQERVTEGWRCRIERVIPTATITFPKEKP